MTSSIVKCLRCGRSTDQTSKEFLHWEAVGDGQRVVCSGCLTGAEQQAIDEDAMAMAEKVRENRLRRMAARQGLRLEKSRRRDTRAADWGTYMLVDATTGALVAYGMQSGYGLGLDDIERALTE